MDKLDDLKNKMQTLESGIEQIKAEYKALEKAYKIELQKPANIKRIKNLEGEIEELRKNEAENLLYDTKLPDLLLRLQIVYKDIGDTEKAEKTYEERNELLRTQHSEEYQNRKIKFLEGRVKKVASTDTWLELWHAYLIKGDSEKAAKAEKKYKELDERDSRHWDNLDNLH